jgi:hypothetical protein
MKNLGRPESATLLRNVVVLLLGSVLGCAGKDSERAPGVRSAGDSQPAMPSGFAKQAGICQDPATPCMRDTAFGRRIDYEPGWLVDARWIVFAEAGDTIQASAQSEDKMPRALSVWLETWGRTDPTRSPQLQMSGRGVVRVTVLADLTGFGGDTIPYALQLRRPQPRTDLRPTGLRSMLTLESTRDADRFSVVPLSMGPVTDRSSWSVYPGTYRVALTSDSLYEVCRLPCAKADTVIMRAGSSLRRQY